MTDTDIHSKIVLPEAFDPFATADEQVVTKDTSKVHDADAPAQDVKVFIPESYDPFADATNDDQVVTKGTVHIRLQQRNGRKCITTVSGLDEKLDLSKVTKALKKILCCNGSVVHHKEFGKIVQLQGDQREQLKKFLTEQHIASESMIKIHGI